MKDFLSRFGVGIVFVLLFIGTLFFVENTSRVNSSQTTTLKARQENTSHAPLSIEGMRKKSYPGSTLVIEEELLDAPNYKQYIASYKSEGFTVYGLLTVPKTEKPESGFPVIIFNHGYIPPEEYRTTEKYVTHVDSFARNGYVVFKPDYRGHGSSEGDPEGAYFSPAYTVDVLNALASVKKLSYIDRNKIGMWGHSMGGSITERTLVIDPTIKAAVIWGGAVGSYENLFQDWWSKKRSNFTPSNRETNANRPSRQGFIDKYGEPSATNAFWNSISPTSFLKYHTAPVQLHHGESDETVPFKLSQDYYDALKKKGKTVEVYLYSGTDHNLSQSFNLAMQRSIEFFDKYLK